MGLQELRLPDGAGVNSRRTRRHPPAPSGSAKACMGEGSNSTTPARYRRHQRTTSSGKSRQERAQAQESNALPSSRIPVIAARESSEQPAKLSLHSPQPQQMPNNCKEGKREGQGTWLQDEDEELVIVEEVARGSIKSSRW